ncbi:MAG: FixH family protein [Gammaproteobacteria bacterium]|nr:FixH family protein [Gammaproteobacteria bacterium]
MFSLKNKLSELNISQDSPHGKNNPWVIGWAIGLGSVVLINIVMIVLAFVSSPGLVDEDYYETGRKYEENAIKMMTARDALRWHVQLNLPETMRINAPSDIHLSLVDVRGVPLHQASVKLTAFRPSDADADFSVTMDEVTPGLFAATVNFPLKGVWDLRLHIQRDSDNYDYEQRITVAP